MSRSTTILVLGLLAVLVAPGCVAAPRVGVFQPGGFYSRRDYYRVRYPADGVDARALLGAAWTTQGYQSDSHGRPTTMRLNRWQSARDVDDFALVHRVDGSEIFARTTPVAPVMAERALEVMMNDMLGSLGGDRFRDRETIVRILDRGPAEVGGAEAYRTVFDLFQVSQQADARTAGRRAYLVIVRPTDWRWDRAAERPSTTGDPMLLVLALVARAETFDAHVAEFEALLDRVDVRPRTP